MEQLLPEVEVLEEGGACLAGPESVLIIGDDHPLARGEWRAAAGGRLVRLAPRRTSQFLVSVTDDHGAVCIWCGHRRVVPPARPGKPARERMPRRVRYLSVG